MELSEISSFDHPPDFAAHERCWMIWPGDRARWGETLDQVQSVCAEVATAIAAFEPVTVLSNPDSLAEASIRCGSKVAALPMPHSDPWMRDCGLTFAIASEGSLQGFYPGSPEEAAAEKDGALDVALARALLKHLKMPGQATAAASLLQRIFLHDGEGTAIVSERALVDMADCGISGRQAVEQELGHLGIEKTIWLLQGLTGGGTAKAIDNLVCFAAPGVVLTLVEKDSDDENHPYLADNLACLQSSSDAKGRALKVIEVPQPPPQKDASGARLPLSYLNLYIANGGVVMPGFEEAEDASALQAVAAAFPEREVMQVPLRELAAFGGGIHRMTLSQPKRPEEKPAGAQ